MVPSRHYELVDMHLCFPTKKKYLSRQALHSSKTKILDEAMGFNPSAHSKFLSSCPIWSGKGYNQRDKINGQYDEA